jgi:hypothetical protein
MADRDLIQGYLENLAGRLPPEVVEELADGLEETVRHHLALGLSPAAAVDAAIEEFGRPAQITTAFARQSAGRRTAVAMLATSPAIAASWGAALIGAEVWNWQIPVGLAVVFGAALVAVAATLMLVARSNYPSTTRLAGPASAVLILLDLSMLAAVLSVEPALNVAFAIAVPASLVRIALSARNLPRLYAR